MNYCLEESDECAGEIISRFALSGSGIAYPRCDFHYDEYVERVQPAIDAVNERYPDSSQPPAWFDPTYAGECWDDDY